jgi:putative redox protein
MRSVKVRWDAAGERFTAVGKNIAHVIATDAPLAPGEQRPPTGFSPTELLLAGAGSCSAWDVVDILRKARIEVLGLDVTVDGEQADSPPYAYRRITLHYRLVCDAVRPSTVARAVRLSISRYCSVLATTAGVAQLAATGEIVRSDGTSTGRQPIDLDRPAPAARAPAT